MTEGTVFYFSHDQQKLARHINPNNTANKKRLQNMLQRRLFSSTTPEN